MRSILLIFLAIITKSNYFSKLLMHQLKLEFLPLVVEQIQFQLLLLFAFSIV